MTAKKWLDKLGIVELLRKRGPMTEMDIARELGRSKQIASYNLHAGKSDGKLQYLEDRRQWADADFSPAQDAIQTAVLRIMDRLSPAGFLSDSSSVPGYGLEMVAQEVGIEPRKIESDFYVVIRKLRTIADGVGNDKQRFFEKVDCFLDNRNRG